MVQRVRDFMIAAVALNFSPVAAQTNTHDGAFTTLPDQMLVHRGSGLQFPLRVAGFRRADSAVFDDRGAYVGVRYSKLLSHGPKMELRIAVVQISQMTPKEHYIISKPMALRGLSHIRTVAEGPYNRVDKARGYRGLFTAVKSGRRTMIGLWAFERGYWDLRARAEFPVVYQEEAEKAVSDFVSELGELNRHSRPVRP